MSAFLRGRRVALHATDARAPAGPDAWLDPGARGPSQDEIVMAIRLPEGDDVGVVGLTAIDWTARTARVCGGGGRLDPPALEDALGLVARYAFDELNLDALEAIPTRSETGTLLRAAGFAAARPGAPLRLRRADGARPR